MISGEGRRIPSAAIAVAPDAYVCFIVDAFSRMIVGWRVAVHMRTDMVFAALEMAYGELGAIGSIGSIGSIGDSYDNVLAETVNGLSRRSMRSWRTQPREARAGDPEIRRSLRHRLAGTDQRDRAKTKLIRVLAWHEMSLAPATCENAGEHSARLVLPYKAGSGIRVA